MPWRSCREQLEHELCATRRSKVAAEVCLSATTGLSGFKRNLQYTVALMSEQVIGIDNVIQFVLVGNQYTQVQPVGRDYIHQPAHALLAAGAQCGVDTVIPQTSGKGINWDTEIL